MPTSVHGLPAHVLLVHSVVVIVPLAALLLLASAWWPAARHKLGFFTPLVALLALVLVPLTTHAGEWLRARVPATPLVNRHAELGDSLLPWVIAMFLVAAVGWYVHAGHRLPGRWGAGARRMRGEPAVSPAGTAGISASIRSNALAATIAAIATVLAIGSIVQIVRIGESGSKAVWQGNVSDQPHPVPGDS